MKTSTAQTTASNANIKTAKRNGAASDIGDPLSSAVGNYSVDLSFCQETNTAPVGARLFILQRVEERSELCCI